MASGLLLRAGRLSNRLIAASHRVSGFPRAVSLCTSRPALATPGARTSLLGTGTSPARAMTGATHRSLRTGALAKEVAFEPEKLPTVGVAPTAQLGSWEGDLLVLAVPEEDFATEAEVTSLKSEALVALDGQLGGVLGEIVAAGGFDGKQGSQSRVLRLGPVPGAKAKQVALVGLGKRDKLAVTAEWGASPFQALGGAVATLAKANKAARVAVALTVQPDEAARPKALAQVAAGALLGGYESTRFKTKKSPTASKLDTLHILADVDEAVAKEAVARGVAVASGNLLTRYLVEAPPNICTPGHLADTAKYLADKFPDVFSLKVYDKAECEAMGMGLFLGVAEASAEPPHFIHLKYSPPGGNASRKLGVVGKGLTFDSGGYNLKAGPGSMIELMKFDMGGAGATLGAARILGELKPADVEVHFIVAACENMVAGQGLRPGDILTSASGKTVEVNNTDAEGRLTLADAMWFAQEKCGVDTLLDVATLTGACIVALGTQIAGLFTPSDALTASLMAASKASGEKLWRLPMENDYFDDLKSAVADMKNTGSRNAGAITAALFLKQYVKEGVEWAHLDVAGPVWNDKAGQPTGYGAALLAEWAIAQGAADKSS